MRVLHVIPSISPRRGGPSTAIIPMVAAMRARGVDAEIATSDEDFEGLAGCFSNPVLREGVPIRLFPRRIAPLRQLRDFSYSVHFGQWLKKVLRNYDLLHVHALFSYFSTTAMTMARRQGTPYVSRPLGQLGVWPLRQSTLRKKIYLGLAEARNLHGADALHFTSRSEQAEAALAGFHSDGVVIPHGIELPAILPRARERLRAEWKPMSEQKIVLFLGRIHRKKGLDLLVTALSRMQEPRPLLLVAGEGADRPDVEKLIVELGLSSHICWLGHVTGARKQLCLQGADLFALTSRHENLGVAVLEAIAAGTPVLISEEVAVSREVAAHRLGTVVPLDVDAIAMALASALRGQPDTERERRRAFVKTFYPWSDNAAALAGLYGRILENRARRSGITAPKTRCAKNEMKSIRTYAPGRAELLGNHTDYNEGYVLAIAVDQGTTLTGQTRTDRMLHLRSRDMEKIQEISLDRLEAKEVADWARYTLGVVDQFRRHDLPIGGFEAEISSTLPMGAGLSSSASLENAAVLFLLQAFGGKLSPLEMAQLSQKAEHEFVGVRCGLLDQIASLMSRGKNTTFIDCRSFAVRHVPMPDDVSFVLAQSGVKHALVAGEYNERRSDCEAAARALGVKALRDVTSAVLFARQSELPERIFQRARHIVGENERVLAGCEALEKSDLKRFGSLMYQSHESSRLYFENSCPELDHLVDVARTTPGVYGARLSGGGFGGATINLVERDAEQQVVQALTAAAPNTTCIVTKAADGALAYAENHPAA